MQTHIPRSIMDAHRCSTFILLLMVVPLLLVVQPAFSASTSWLSPQSGLSVAGASNAPIEGDTLRLFTYNIHHGRGLDDRVDIRRIADVIAEKDPHIVALQEVDVGVERSGGIDIMTVLAGHLWRMEPVFYENIPHEGGQYGNGILTSLPLLSSRNLHYVMSRDAEQRGLLQVEVEFNGVTIAVMNTHLDNRHEDERLTSVKQIIETKRAYRGRQLL